MELCAAACHRTVEWFGLEGAPLPWAGYHVPSVICSSSIHTASADLQTGLRTGGGGGVTAPLNSCHRVTDWVGWKGPRWSPGPTSRIKQGHPRVCGTGLHLDGS